MSMILTSAFQSGGGTFQVEGTITGGAANALIHHWITISGFVTPQYNGTFFCTFSNAFALILSNGTLYGSPILANETHAGLATDGGGSTGSCFANGWNKQIHGQPNLRSAFPLPKAQKVPYLYMDAGFYMGPDLIFVKEGQIYPNPVPVIKNGVAYPWN